MKNLYLIAVLFLAGCTITGYTVKEPSFDYKVYFCPKTDCLEEVKTLIETAEKADCAFYSIDKELVEEVKDKNVRLIVDSNSKLNYSFIKKDFSSKLMHNKFCIINRSFVLTGSFNPTKRTVKDKNNMILIKSVYLAKNYEEEFEELWEGTFHKGKKTKYKEIYLNETLIKSWFCPEDNCAEKVIKELKNAEKSIYFLSYSFTHQELAECLLEKGKEIEVKGVFFGEGEYSQYERLRNNSLAVRLYKGKGLMHNKVFIIDNKTIIIGSFNPTTNAANYNDENVLIIRNKELTKLYLEEFEDIYEQSR